MDRSRDHDPSEEGNCGAWIVLAAGHERRSKRGVSRRGIAEICASDQ
jgi:hypothetical protein